MAGRLRYQSGSIGRAGGPRCVGRFKPCGFLSLNVTDAGTSMVAHCDAWLAAWNGNQPEALLAYYADACTYSDPAKPRGLQGKEDLARYLRKLCAAYPHMDWRRETLWPLESARGYVVQYTATIGVGERAVVERGMDLVLLDAEGLIVRNDVYFDRVAWLEAAAARHAPS